jgi:hypothetical protein
MKLKKLMVLFVISNFSVTIEWSFRFQQLLGIVLNLCPMGQMVMEDCQV